MRLHTPDFKRACSERVSLRRLSHKKCCSECRHLETREDGWGCDFCVCHIFDGEEFPVSDPDDSVCEYFNSEQTLSADEIPQPESDYDRMKRKLSRRTPCTEEEKLAALNGLLAEVNPDYRDIGKDDKALEASRKPLDPSKAVSMKDIETKKEGA